MDRDFRKKTFRGAKIEDIIQEFERLIQLCEQNRDKSDSLDRQRFYEGMAIAYTTVSLKLKGEFDYIEAEAVEQLCHAAEKTGANSPTVANYTDSCSFCGKSKSDVGELALGPGVSICRDCLQFGVAVIDSQSPKG
ncbi:ClpX C4-type zinc finger protein [Brevibacillus borstelensis]|uniref:ClpX C4-type zinc finger protein n=1 Tax=Brevibacillus borstelensis TaxID=45462 RepID=UPI00203ACF1D|nr:ClpX C4-type zinc finger protein [Brevibacillus borstelensis]MCM3623638.1 ClpX C4-type zinc finger protein [Brevibacillus borstelensis]WNF06529.1 ClpX C4-type zinc finger protein [Brevibacillus borstelensis]